jgi:hypothetical protein
LRAWEDKWLFQGKSIPSMNLVLWYLTSRGVKIDGFGLGC